jgi:uncharacterized protein (TIGR02147 family)
MSKALFDYTDYKDYLRDRLESTHGLISRLAEASGCQRSYLSRVIHGDVHLTPDQGHKACEYWRFSLEESEYFMTLLELGRAGTPSYRSHLERKITHLQRMNENIAKRLQRKKLPTRSAVNGEIYYSTWLLSALHVAVGIPKLQTPRSLANHLQIPLELVENGLRKLEDLGLVRNIDERWTFASEDIHVPKESPWVACHHNNWRQRSILDAQRASPDSTHFTNVQAMDRKAYQQIRRLIGELIDSAAQIADPAPSEELVCFNIDLFHVG